MGGYDQRISALIDALNITKTSFAERLNVSQAFVSQLCSGAKQRPSDRTISDICREFNVNEDWLRTGSGEMFVPLTRDEQIEVFMGEVLRDEPGDFRRRLISVLSRLTESEWELLEKKLKEIVGTDEEA